MTCERRLAAWIRGALTVLPWALWTAGGCAADGGPSYSRDVQPIFEKRCIRCHYSGNTDLVDIEDPFTLDFGSAGIVGSRNPWALEHDTLPEYNLLPYEPDASFVLQKVSDRELRPGCDSDAGPCKTDQAGFFMPPAPRRLSEVKRAAVRLWIVTGARDNDFYRSEVLPIFGDPANRRDTECEEGGMEKGCIVCITCHYEGAPDAPDLTRPFDPVVGVVGVKSMFRADLDLVVPGEPEQSLLMKKLDAVSPTSELGAPMPHGYPPLLEREVELLREWIADGARDD